MADKTGITVKPDTDDDITANGNRPASWPRKRPGPHLAKQQAMAERIASASEQLLAGVEETAAGTEICPFNGNNSPECRPHR